MLKMISITISLPSSPPTQEAVKPVRLTCKTTLIYIMYHVLYFVRRGGDIWRIIEENINVLLIVILMKSIILQQWSHIYNSHLPYHHRYSLHNRLYYVIKYTECIQLPLDLYQLPYI